MATFEEDFLNQTEIANWSVVDLPEKQTLRHELECGYEIRSSKGLVNGDENTTEAAPQYRIIELWKDGEIVYTDRDTEYNVNRCPIDTETPENLPKKMFSCVKAYLEKNEPDKVEWMRKKYAPEPVEIPPWDRYDGEKFTKNTPTREYFIHGKTAATSDEIENLKMSATPAGNAERFRKECSGFLVHDIESDKWYCKSETYWKEATSELTLSNLYVAHSIQSERIEIEKLYKAEENRIKNSAEPITDITGLKETMTRFKKLAEQTPNLKNMKDMSEIAGNLESIKVEFTEKFKSESTKFIGCNNGILNTLTGEFTYIFETEKIEEILKEYPLNHIDCTYTPNQKSDLFIEHLKKVCYDNTSEPFSEDKREDEEIREMQAIDVGHYLRQHIAYTLYPGNPNRIFQFWWGDGKNGKSVTISLLKEIFGESLYGEANIQELYATDKDIPRSATAEALDKRFLIYSEAEDDEEKGGRISRSMVVNLVGDDKTSKFRKCHRDAKESYVICAVIATCNQFPRFDKPINTALLDRLSIIPFKHRFTKEETIPNFHKKLFEEKDAIFSMIVDDYIGLVKRGLVLPEVPDCIKPDTRRLLAGFSFYSFIEFCITKCTDSDDERKNRISRYDIEYNYIKWCVQHHLDYKAGRSLTEESRLAESEKKKLLSAMRTYGFKDCKSHGERYFIGCTWNKDWMRNKSY